MKPYASEGEKKVGSNRPKIQHLPEKDGERRTKREREAEKEAIVAERRAIKKAARRNLKAALLSDLEEA